MRIAVCDDDRQELIRVLDRLASYQEQRQIDLRCQGFESATELLAAMDSEEYDLLLLDVLMPGLNGIQAAQEIRKKNESVKIVFLTSSPEFAVESYSVQASSYLLKPATQERLFPVLDRLVSALRKPAEALIIQTKGSVLRLPFDHLEAVEVIAKTLYFHMADGSTREVHRALADYEYILLARPEFYKVHRSYLVSFRWVTEIHTAELITTSGRHVPIARSTCQQVRAAYMEYLFHAGLWRERI